MVDIADVSGLGVPDAGWKMRSARPLEDPKWRLDQLVPLLHQLLIWDLVRTNADGEFVLREDVQDRLALLTSGHPSRSAEVFVGRKCEVCGLVKLTRIVDGVRTCSTCSTVGMVREEPVANAVDPIKAQRGFFHRQRKAS